MAYFQDDKNYWEKPKPQFGSNLDVMQLLSQISGAPPQAQSGYMGTPGMPGYGTTYGPPNPSVLNPPFSTGPNPQWVESSFGSNSGSSSLADRQISDRYPPSPNANVGSSSSADRQIQDRAGSGFDTGAFGDFLKRAMGAGIDAADQVAAEDPMTIYEQIRKATPGYSYKGPSAEAMANRQYDPLFKMLASQRTAGTDRYNTAKTNALKSYASYGNDLAKSQKNNQATYTDVGNAIAAAGKTAADTVSQNTSKANQEAAALAKNLGQLEAAPQLMAENTGRLTDALGTVAANQQTATALNKGLGAATKTHDQDSIDISKGQGINYQGDLLGDYTNFLNQNDQQQYQTQSDKGGALNNYTMSIEELLSKAAGDREGAISKQFQSFMDQINNKHRWQDEERDDARASQSDADRLELDRARLELDKKLGLGKLAQDGQKGDSAAKVSESYSTLRNEISHSGISQADSIALLNAVGNAMRLNPEAKEVGQLLQSAQDAAEGDDIGRSDLFANSVVNDLAVRFFSRYLGKG